MNLSDAGCAFIKGWEKCSLKAYYDQAGLATIGWGHLLATTPWVPLSQFPDITQECADALFLEDALPKEQGVSVLFSTTPLLPRQFDALVSLAFNIGVAALAGSTLRRAIQGGQPHDVISAAFLMWDKVKDPISGQLVTSAGLHRRRQAEAAMYSGVAGAP
ncbi:MAG TPA: lysozyme [Dongiaceae bacterium]|jgi:GH24 family phage-related lysozyme (muramidase)|nr:lysozyme [Dongiaceae bacterium]